jgi:uncharacterized protein
MGIEGKPAPVRLEERIDTLDLLRGVAICGILLMNIPAMGMIGESGRPAFPARWNPDWVLWSVQTVLFEGTMRGLFTMLFGAGMLLMLRRAEGIDPQVTPFDVWTRRCLALMALGVVQWAVFMWPGEILWLYGASGLFLLAFRNARPRILIGSAAALLLVLTVHDGFDGSTRATTLQASIPAAAAKAAGKTLTEDQQGALKAAEKIRASFHPSAADVEKEMIQRTHLPALLAWSWADWREYNLELEFWIGLLESCGFMMIGMALYRTGILTSGASGATYARLMAIGYGGGLTLRLVSLWWGSRTGFDFDIARLNPIAMTLRNADYEPARLLVTLGHVGLLMTLWRAGLLGRAVTLRAFGRMALTVYSLQSILTSLLFYGFGYVGAFGFAALMGIAALIWIATAILCRLWLARFAMGPAEALLRAIAYNGIGHRRPAAAAAKVPAI